MLNLLLILAFAGVIVISAGFAGVTFMQGVQSSLDAEITTARLLDVATQVQSHMRYLDPQGTGNQYQMALPVGANGTAPYAYSQVPSFITSSANSASGVPFEYCPYSVANNGGTTGTVTMASGATYNIKTYSGTDTNSQNYDTDQNGTTTPTNSDPNVMGLLVAAAPNQFYPPDCSAVTTDSSGAYTVGSGGIVKVIANDFLNKMNVPSAMTDFHLYVNTAATGDGSGRDPNNYITLADALTMIQAVKPANAILYLYSAATTPGTAYSTSATFSYGGRIELVGYGGVPTITTSGTTTVDEYSTLAFNNVVFNTGFQAITVNGTLELAGTLPVFSATGTVTTAGTEIASSGAGVQIFGGALKSFNGGIATSMSTVKVDAGGVMTTSGPMDFENLGNRGFSVINGHVYGGTTMKFNSATANIVPVIVKAGGELVAGSGTMTIGNASTGLGGGVIVDPGGRFVGVSNSANRGTGGSIVNADKFAGASTYGFYVHGEMDLLPQSAANAATANVAIDYGAAPPATGIILASGGKFLLEATTGVSLGTSAHHPTNGIADYGGSGFYTMGSTGNNIIYGTTACWANNAVAPTNIANLFTDSALGTGTGNSTATQTTTFPNGWYRLYNNSKNLICN